jgi:hypothetical protein
VRLGAFCNRDAVLWAQFLDENRLNSSFSSISICWIRASFTCIFIWQAVEHLINLFKRHWINNDRQIRRLIHKPISCLIGDGWIIICPRAEKHPFAFCLYFNRSFVSQRVHGLAIPM